MKKQLLKSALIGVAGVGLLAGSAMAGTVTFQDTWNNWDNQAALNPAAAGKDVIGNPQISKMVVNYDDATKMLSNIQVFLTNRLTFDSLFINTDYGTGTAWDSWDYYVKATTNSGQVYSIQNFDGGITTAGQITDYTVVTVPYPSERGDNPNGIDFNKVDERLLSQAFVPTYVNNVLTYDLTSFNMKYTTGFYVAYAPYCANDVMGGGAVPEPATMLLFGSGIAGLAAFARRRKSN